MTVLNVSLCLPELDIVALCQKQSIVVVTKRFIVPDKSFALSPCRNLSEVLSVDDLYHPELLPQLKASAASSSLPLMAKYWAQCVFCQQVVDEEAIAAISDRTIWKKSALLHHLQNRGNLFLSFLKVYELPEAKSIDTEPVCDQLYKFLPLPGYLEVNYQNPVLNDDEFAAARTAILAPAESVSHDGDSQNDGKAIPELVAKDAVDSPDWVSKISEIGNSSDGHTFEKLVRKGLIELGFRNTLARAEASLDPYATGGAGGLDFYADQPYPIVGECKATKAKKVGSDPATQLHKLGGKWLTKEEYKRCVQLIVAGGTITFHANKTAIGHNMNVIRPETLQSLLELKIKYENSVEPSDLKTLLQSEPFGMKADTTINSYIQEWEAKFKRNAQYFQQSTQVVQSVKELSKQTIHKEQNAFVAIEIRAHYNAKYHPCVTDEAIKDMLRILSSPASGCLGSKQLPGDQERFYFIRDMRPLGA